MCNINDYADLGVYCDIQRQLQEELASVLCVCVWGGMCVCVCVRVCVYVGVGVWVCGMCWVTAILP